MPRDFRLLGEIQDETIESAACLNYLSSRGIKDRDVWFYKLGYSTDTRWIGRVLVPSFDDSGELNYFIGRTIYQGSKRYDQPELPKVDVIFNDINIDWTRELVLCEGPFDLIKCRMNATCLLGSELDESYFLFEKIIKNKTPICLLLDDDVLLKKTISIAKLLNSFDIKVRIAMLPANTDPGSLHPNAVQHFVDSAEAYTWLDSFKLKLAARSKVKMSL